MDEKRQTRDTFIFRAAWGTLIYQILAIANIFTKEVVPNYLIKGTDTMGAIVYTILIMILPLVCILSVILGMLLARRKADRPFATFLLLVPLVMLGAWLVF